MSKEPDRHIFDRGGAVPGVVVEVCARCGGGPRDPKHVHNYSLQERP